MSLIHFLIAVPEDAGCRKLLKDHPSRIALARNPQMASPRESQQPRSNQPQHPDAVQNPFVSCEYMSFTPSLTLPLVSSTFAPLPTLLYHWYLFKPGVTKPTDSQTFQVYCPETQITTYPTGSKPPCRICHHGSPILPGMKKCVQKISIPESGSLWRTWTDTFHVRGSWYSQVISHPISHSIQRRMRNHLRHRLQLS
jgi:hypothetical protein